MTLDLSSRGDKRVCASCAARFYDLRRPEPICPRCGAAFVESARVLPPRTARRSRASFSRTAPKPATAAEMNDAPVMDISASEDPTAEEDETEDEDEVKDVDEQDDDDRAARDPTSFDRAD